MNGQGDALLLLSALYLPGGASGEEHTKINCICEFLQVNDLISAEIQEARYDGTLTLHTRSRERPICLRFRLFGETHAAAYNHFWGGPEHRCYDWDERIHVGHTEFSVGDCGNIS